jgi:hypothetical protein
MSNLIEMSKFIHTPKAVEKRLDEIDSRLIRIENFLKVPPKVELTANYDELLELIKEPEVAEV